MRIYKMITKGKLFFSFNKFSQLNLLENEWRSGSRISMWRCGDEMVIALDSASIGHGLSDDRGLVVCVVVQDTQLS